MELMPRQERGLRSVKRLSRSSILVTLLGATVLVALAAAGIAGGASAPKPILLSQNNCVGNAGAASCDVGWVLDHPNGVALRGDGSGVLVTATDSDALAVFKRERPAGTLTQKPGTSRPACTSETGAGPCQDGHAFIGPMGVGTTSDDSSVYVASNGSEAIDILNKERDSRQFVQGNGTAGCISEDGTGGQCVDGRGLTGASSIAIAPASDSVYVGGTSTIAAFKRNNSNGALTQLPSPSGVSTDACINDDGSDGCFNGFVPGDVVSMAFSTDGKFLYAAVSGSPGALLVFSRTNSSRPLTELATCYNADGSNGCTAVTGLDDPTGVALDRSAKNVYVAASGSGKVVGLVRNKTTGLLTTSLTLPAVSVANVNQITVASNNKSAYVTSDAGVTSFNRSKKTGVLTQGDCLTDSGGCIAPAGHGLAGGQGVVSASSYKDVYVAGSTDDAIVALKHT
jgi:hypothetical protein